ncbi:hypothetical protein M885DRAFT_221524 [Pelagophyceae sp. CCMP2097]|nr:hypothetical protein M885DRAFT_221524 [Pelagophyceae sp. CCMP2097]
MHRVLPTRRVVALGSRHVARGAGGVGGIALARRRALHRREDDAHRPPSVARAAVPGTESTHATQAPRSSGSPPTSSSNCARSSTAPTPSRGVPRTRTSTPPRAQGSTPRSTASAKPNLQKCSTRPRPRPGQPRRAGGDTPRAKAHRANERKRASSDAG